MKISEIYVTQRKLRCPQQIPSMVGAIDYLPPLVLSEDENGVILVEDGHHRLMAYWLSGRTELHKGEYLLVLKESHKRRFGRIIDLQGRSGF